jgi:uncharacterized membrane protein
VFHPLSHDDQSPPARVADRVTAVFGSWPSMLVWSGLIVV